MPNYFEGGLLTGLTEGVRGGLQAYNSIRDRKDRQALEEMELEQKNKALLAQEAERKDTRERLAKELVLKNQKDRAGLIRQGYKPLLAGESPKKGVITTTIGDETFGFDPAEEQAKRLEIARATALAGQDVKGSVAQQAADKAAGEEYQKWVSGGSAVAQDNVDKIKKATSDLMGDGGTGGILGGIQSIPLIGEPAVKLINPKRVAVKQDIDSVVLGFLKQRFGGNPTEGERKALLDTVYDPMLPKETVADRVAGLGTLINQQQQAAQQQADYIEKHGTVRGYKGPVPISKAEFMASVEALKNDSSRAQPASGLIQEANAVGKSGLTPDQRAKRIQELKAKLGK